MSRVTLTKLTGQQTMQDWFWKNWTVHQSGREDDSWKKLRRADEESSQKSRAHMGNKSGHKPTIESELQKWRRKGQAK